MFKGRAARFGIICAAAIALPITYGTFRRTGPPADTRAIAADAAALAAVTARPHLQFRDTTVGPRFGALSIVPLENVHAPRLTTPLQCERAYFSGGTGICLAADRGFVTSYRAEVYDSAFQRRHLIPFTGAPSRARVALDGRYAAMTYFVSGDSYAAGGFSTRTILVDPLRGATVANLEDFAVTNDGAPFKAVDFNFWGVTFSRSESDAFFATLGTRGKTYLIKGSISTRTARVLRDRLECPSLSPNGRYIAFKRRMPGLRLVWRIHVLDLETNLELPTAETRSVDDQIEWLDDDTVLYALPDESSNTEVLMSIWAVRADGTGQPRLLIENAESPAVVR